MRTDLPAIEIENVTRRFGEVTALAGVSVVIRQGEFFSLLGPSGCGKTTLLRIIGGLDWPDGGRIRIGGVDVEDIPAHRRPVNTVFQSYALFPHMTVFDNVSFGLRMKRVPRDEMVERTRKIMDIVEIEDLAGRRPAQLSGGQKQRVALARAVVNEPQVLLLDEPLGALDLKLRKQLQVELLALQRRLGITFVYVTHDQEEALVMSDRIAVMQAGRIEQMDEAEALYERPRKRFVAQFLGSCNLFDAAVEEREAANLAVRTSMGPLRVAAASAEEAAAVRDRFTLAIRPEKIALRPLGYGGRENAVAVRVEEVIYVGSETHYLLRTDGLTLRAEAMNVQAGPQGYERGQEAVAYFPPAALLALDD